MDFNKKYCQETKLQFHYVKISQVAWSGCHVDMEVMGQSSQIL
jgi:hypothetical protein